MVKILSGLGTYPVSDVSEHMFDAHQECASWVHKPSGLGLKWENTHRQYIHSMFTCIIRSLSTILNIPSRHIISLKISFHLHHIS
eukprot:1419008-Karenia_brevis.AAC.1